MQNTTGRAAGIAVTILALLIGIFGVAALIAVGEAANNTIAAFAAISFPFAVLAAIFSWIAPRARWAIAVAMFGPVAAISVLGSWSSRFLIPGAIWTAGLTCAGAYLGARGRAARYRGGNGA